MSGTAGESDTLLRSHRRVGSGSGMGTGSGIVDSPYQHRISGGDDGGGRGKRSKSPALRQKQRKQKRRGGGGGKRYKKSKSDLTSSERSAGDSSNGGLSGSGGGGGDSQQHQPNGLQRVASHLSLMMGESGESGDGTDGGGVGGSLSAGANPHQVLIMRSSAVWRKRLVVFTAVFIVATVLVRWRNEWYEERLEDGRIGGGSAVAGEDVGGVSSAMGPFDDGEENVRMSCGEFFEPSPIMRLKNSSTVENMENGVVAADDVRCSELGISVLRDMDGNAVDAAVATMLCLGVVNPASSGIGGGAFILVHADAGSHAAKVGHKDYVSPDFDDLRSGVARPEIAEMLMESLEGTMAAGDGAEEVKTKKGNDGTGRREKVTEMIDCRETAPGGSSYDMFEHLHHGASTEGGLSIAVPGELRGLELAHSRHGRLPWSEVVRPAMELARDGFEVSKHLASDIRHKAEAIFRHPNLAEVLTRDRDGKTLLEEGDVMKRPKLAEMLRLVMRDGADAMYKGDVAETIASDVREAGGIITAEDLAGYRPAVRDPLVARDIYGFTVVGAPPPSSGGATVIGAARFLAGYADPLAAFADTLSKHRFVEACKHAFAMRMSLCDPAFEVDGRNDTAEVVEDLVGGPYMEELRRKTLDHDVLPMSWYGGSRWAKLKDGVGDQDDLKDAHEGDRRKRRMRRVAEKSDGYDVLNYLEDHGTTHLSVVDKDRNVVAITSTVNLHFGSKVVSPSTGIFFNDQMDDFSTPGMLNYFGLEPSEANYIEPGKRPLSSMSPTMIFRRDYDEKTPENDLGKFFMAIGASGGPKIITSVLQVFLNYAVLGMPLFESVADPRIHDQLLYHGQASTNYDEMKLLQGPVIEVTSRIKQALAKRNHRLLAVDYLGTSQVVAVDLETDRLAGVSDIRKVGCPAGY